MTHPILNTPVYQPPKSPLDEFDPNHRDKGAPPWASYCPGRSPKFKTHGNRGFAINSMHNHKHYGSILYAFEDGKWVEKGRFEAGEFRSKTCDACHGTTLEDHLETQYDATQRRYVQTGRTLKHFAGYQTFEKRNGKIVTPERVLTLCAGCYRGLGY